MSALVGWAMPAGSGVLGLATSSHIWHNAESLFDVISKNANREAGLAVENRP
jgi:hypothetical protein